MSIFLELVIIIIGFLFLEAFFTGSEMALVAANRKRLGAMARPEGWGGRVTKRILQDPSWYLSTTLLGSNLAEATNTALVTSILIGVYGAKGDFWAFLLLSPLILIFGEILPKTLFQQKAEHWAPRLIPVIWVVSVIAFPCVWFVSRATALMLRLLGLRSEQVSLITREELQLLLRVEGSPSDMKTMEQDMIHRIFRFSSTKVKEVMIPLVDVAAMEEKATVEEAMALARQENYSRYPVFRERVDHIVGILHSFDLLFPRGSESTITSFIHPISYFPETKPVDELLLELQRNHEAMAVVVDEYGGAVGIVTVEDILEEVVGEIEDEYDIGPPLYKKVGSNRYLINARMEIDHVNEYLKLNLPKEDYETLGGFVLEKLGKVPLAGESFRFQGMVFEVLKASERSVSEILVTLQE